MDMDLKNYFLSLDLTVRNLYGMTELTVHSVATEHDQMDSIGKALDGTQAKILLPDSDGQGELCVKGRHVFMGYLNENEKTLETVDENGWLHTGDFGTMDKNGITHITGRMKEIIITSGGENVAPVPIETFVKAECSAISNAFLVGDNRHFLNILVTLKTECDADGLPTEDLAIETVKWMEKLNLNYTKLHEVLAAGPDQKVLKKIQDAIESVNAKSISNAQKIQKFAILPRDFSFATGELGATLKLKRRVVEEKYRSVIEKFYETWSFVFIY